MVRENFHQKRARKIYSHISLILLLFSYIILWFVVAGQANRSNNRTPSPWHPVNGSQQSGRSPISPAVPSPYQTGATGAGGNTIEPVSSTTQVLLPICIK